MFKARWIAPIFLLMAAVIGCKGSDKAQQIVSAGGKEVRKAVDHVTEKIPEPNQAYEWAKQDLGNRGDWEYQILDLNVLSSEQLEAVLNRYGHERWEVFWLERSDESLRVYLKRNSKTYLNVMPLSALP